MYSRILVPVDGPPSRDPAVRKAIDLAQRHGSTVTAVHVLRTERVASVPMESAWPGVLQMARGEGEAILKAVEEFVAAAGVPVETILREGTASREIVAVATEEQADLIIMATEGRGGLNRLLLGSVTELVVRQSPVPVLTVRRDHDQVVTEESSVDANVTG